jgi:5-methylcytosine-specific restriction endonuclease McrA
MNEEAKEDIIKWINSEKERIKTLSIIDIGFPCRLSKSAEEYKSIPIHIRALQYTKELINFDKRLGDSYYYIYVESFGTSIRKSSRMKKNKEKTKLQVSAWREKNLEYSKKISKEWKQRNKAKVRSYRAKRNFFKNKNGLFKISEKEIDRLLSKKCYLCGEKDSEHIDHIIPLSRGGSHSIGNLLGACSACNLSKGAKLLIQYKRDRIN